jgi:hypothetical protein
MPYFMANPSTTTFIAATILYLTCVIWLCLYYRDNKFPHSTISIQASVAIATLWSNVDKTRIFASLQEFVPYTIFINFLIIMVLGPPYMVAMDWTDQKVREWYRARRNRNTFNESI